MAVEVRSRDSAGGPELIFRTNIGDEIACGPDNRLRFERQADSGGFKPYLHVRRDLWAKATRPVYYDLVELGEQQEVGGVMWFGVRSQGEFFKIAPADELEDLSD
jgi:hypothetical protein